MILLDANVLVWWVLGDPRLGRRARAVLEASHGSLTASLLSLFEIELKITTGKLRLPAPMHSFLTEFEIPVYSPLAQELPVLFDVPIPHHDPFDQALMSLAQLKNWDVMTSDTKLHPIRLLRSTVIDSRK